MAVKHQKYDNMTLQNSSEPTNMGLLGKLITAPSLLSLCIDIPAVSSRTNGTKSVAAPGEGEIKRSGDWLVWLNEERHLGECFGHLTRPF